MKREIEEIERTKRKVDEIRRKGTIEKGISIGVDEVELRIRCLRRSGT